MSGGDLPSGIFSHVSTRPPINAPTIPLMIATAATVFLSPPRFSVAGIARASVKLRLAKAKLRVAEIPMAKHTLGYAYSDPMESTRLGSTIAVKC